MTRIHRFFFLSLVFILCGLTCCAHAYALDPSQSTIGLVQATHLRVELIPNTQTISPGGTTHIGLAFQLDPGWHIYWINAGDSGQPPSLQWSLPSGITAGPMQFPTPMRLPLGSLMDYGYQDSVVLPFLISASAAMKSGPFQLQASARWLVCREVCIPGSAHLALNLSIGGEIHRTPSDVALASALEAIPKPLPPSMQASVLADHDHFLLTLTGAPGQVSAEFYPLDPDQIVNSASQSFDSRPDGLRLRIQRLPGLTSLPSQLHGVLRLADREAFEINPAVTPGQLPRTSATSDSADQLTAFSAAGLAFLGGIILNLMPCVFPVLFLKGLALVQSSTEERRELRMHGLIYTSGILLSFWIVVAALLLLRSTGNYAGWGFQLQSPLFIAILASLLFFLALSLAGQFDVGLSLTSAGGSLTQKTGYTGSFFTGVLATVVATPCMGPFLGAAVGFALAQPPIITFAVFTAMALGLASPYLLLTAKPGWIRILPRPGAWMEVLKQLTAVPLFATVIWLTWVYARMFPSPTGNDADHVVRLLSSFLLLAMAGWALGRWPARWRGTATALALGSVAVATLTIMSKPQTQQWLPFSSAALEQARAQHRPIFIDFTAAWCLSCQVNERTVLQSDAVEQQLSSRHFILLKADWTQYDPAITQQLAQLGRSGVPTYVVYPPFSAANPDVLPELLLKSDVLRAIGRDSR